MTASSVGTSKFGLPKALSAEHQCLMQQGIPLVNALICRMSTEVFNRADLDDLRQIGMVALLEAATRFDPAYEVPFHLWAYQRVRGALVDGLHSITGLSRAQIRAIIRYSDALNAETDRVPQKVPSILCVVRGQYVDALVDEHDLVTRPPNPEHQTIQRDTISHIIEIVKELPTEEREVVKSLYGQGMNLAEVARERGVSRSWLSRVHSRAIVKIQAAAAQIFNRSSAYPLALIPYAVSAIAASFIT